MAKLRKVQNIYSALFAQKITKTVNFFSKILVIQIEKILEIY